MAEEKKTTEKREIVDTKKGLDKTPKTPGEERPKVREGAVNKDAERMANPKLTMRTRKNAFKRIDAKMMNPVPEEEFDPETFDPMENDPNIEVKRRPRTEPPKRLPTLGMKPKQLKEGQMVGMYESKQDLYLLIAWLSERVTDLEEELKIKSQ